MTSKRRSPHCDFDCFTALRRECAMPWQALYRRVLGERFDTLPDVLKRFHGPADKSNARGVFRVTRGKGFLRNLVATMLRMPRAGDDVPVHLEVIPLKDCEIWLRHFPGQTLKSVQWAREHLLIELWARVVFEHSRIARVPGRLRLCAGMLSGHAGAASARARHRGLCGRRRQWLAGCCSYFFAIYG
jgi:Domain of unknown function (DUF4166)